MNPCKWCNEPVKLNKNETCSRSCGSALRWDRLKKSGKLVDFEKKSEFARRTAMHKRLQEEVKRACDELGIELTSNIRKFYIRARNRGYLNGYAVGVKR